MTDKTGDSLVFEYKDGQVKESGSHNQLMEQKGEYAQLFNAQKQLEEGYKSGKASAEVVA